MATEQAGEEVKIPDPQREQEDSETADAEELLVRLDSEETPTLSVVMPTLNEEEGVRECIDQIKTAIRTLGVKTEIIVSDSSTDRTPDIATSMGASVIRPDEEGYGYAYQYAFERARGEYIAFADADTTYDFEELPRLLNQLIKNDADMIMGSRLEGEIKPGAMPALHQYVGNPLLTAFLNLFYDVEVSDAHSGYRIITREALEELELESDGMEFASEMIMDASARNLKIVETPITYHERTGEATLDSFRDGWRHVRFMLENAPGYLFSAPGMSMGAVGFLLMICVVGGVQIGSTNFGVHSMVAGSLLTITGLQVASFGVFAAVAGDPIRTPRDPLTTFLTKRLRLEYGATFGLVLAGVGGGYGLSLVGQWAASGFTRLPFAVMDMVAFTAIVVGVQIVFSSFLLSAIAE